MIFSMSLVSSVTVLQLTIFVSLLQEMTGKSVILLPVGAGDDGAHSQNEKIDVRNYIEGVMILLFNFDMLSVALLQHT